MILAAAVSLLVTPTHDWLLRPWDGFADHRIAPWAAWHGRLMVAGWAVSIPLGTLAARYFKIWPGQRWPAELDDRRWWHLHRALQSIGIACATLALWLAWREGAMATAAARWHGIAGWTVMIIGWSQLAGGVLRGSKGGPTDPRARPPAWHGDHFTMTRRRVLFEWAHKLAGHAAIALTLVVVPLGLTIANAPRWMWLTIALWWIGLGCAAVRLQRAGRCIDTYQAIWGPDGDLPGNRLRPIGWGISRAPSPAPADRAW